MATEMKLITDITLELTGETKRYEVVAKQGDKATRFVRITLKNNGQDFEIPAGMKVIANIQKPDRKCCYNTCSYSGSTVTMELTNQALAVAGTAECDIEIRDANDEVVLSSQAFTIEIEKSMRNENAIESSNEFTQLEKDVKEYAEKYFKENPVSGMTTEQEKQLNENTKELEIIKQYIGFGLIVLSETSLTIKDGMTKKFSVKLGYAPESNQKVNISVDKERLTLDKTELIFTPDNFSVEQVITINDKGDPDESDDTANITVSAVVNASSLLIGKIIPVTIKELAYTNTGLIADYDAMKNTRAGYDGNSTVWEDLSGHNYDIDLTIKGETSGVISLNKDMTYDSTKNGFNWTGTSLIIREETSQGASIDIETEVLTTGFSVNLVVKCGEINGYGSIARVINSPDYLATEPYYQSFCCIPANGNTVQGLNGYGGNALRKPIGNSINKNQIMLTYTEDVNENCSMYINGQLTTTWKNGDNYGKHPSYIIYFLQFFKNIKAEVSHMSIYNKVLTSQEIIDTFDYFDKKYGLSNIQGVALNITPSGTVYPYTEIPFTASVIPNNKENDTDVVITSESDNAEVIE